MTNNRINNISSDELCAKLKVADVRSLLTTEGFPKPLFDGKKLMFNLDEVARHFNIENFDEPFITLKEAAEFLGINPPHLQSLIGRKEVPFYRLKSTKGSGYLFRKSEIEFLNEIKIEGNTDFVNYFIGTDIMRDLFSLFIKEHFKDMSTVREYEILCMYFFDRCNFEVIAQKTDLTRERVRQIFNKSVRRLRGRIISATRSNLLELERSIIHKDIEISHLKKLLKNDKPNIILDDNYSEHIDSIGEIYVKFLSQSLYDEDISVRAMNCLKSIDYYTVYDLLINHNSYNNGFKELLRLRNMGKKTANELIPFVKSKEQELEKLTGVSTKEFLLNKSDSPLNVLLFMQVHAKMGYKNN